MTDEAVAWVSVANYRTQFAADVVIERLEAEGIMAIARGNDIIGIFGPGFQGATPRGVNVLVPSDALAAAQEVLRST